MRGTTLGVAVVPDFNYDAEAGLITRAGVPQASVDKLALALAGIVAMPQVSAGFAKAGLEPASDTTPERLANVCARIGANMKA